MTNEQINALVAEKVMGWKWFLDAVRPMLLALGREVEA